MKQIVFVKDMNDENAVSKLKEQLDLINVEYTVQLRSQTVIVIGDNDKLYAAKQAIAQAGFTVL